MKFLFQWVKLVFLNLVGLFRRALCCFSRKRRPSMDSHNIDVVIVGPTSAASNAGKHKTTAERDWNSWDDSPRTVEEHIEQYRQRLTKPPTPPPATEPEDLFKELTPVIQPQPKYYLGGPEEEKVNFSRLAANVDVPIAMNAELEDWEDDNINGGWEELDSQEAKQMIREKRREKRNQRQRQETRINGIVENGAFYGHSTTSHSSRMHT